MFFRLLSNLKFQLKAISEDVVDRELGKSNFRFIMEHTDIIRDLGVL